MFKTHLDLGFTDLAENVKRTYMEVFIPEALRLARMLEDTSEDERFVWTLGSWLVYHYLEESDSLRRRDMERAIERGHIAWHALPFTVHSEFMDVSLFRYGLSLFRRLDSWFGKKTVSAKMSDVPGHTKGIVPLLSEAGVRFLHIGVNAASTPPGVPPLFRWRCGDGQEVVVAYSRGGYGDTVLSPAGAAALAFAHGDDNSGPPSAEQVSEVFASLRRRYPGSVIRASTLDQFAGCLSECLSELPVVTDEIGDTWIHGLGTDPTKTRWFREAQRFRCEWENAGVDESSRDDFERLSDGLLCVAEHTWGLDVKTHLNDWQNWDIPQFEVARQPPNFRKMEMSWLEQREYIDRAIAGLRNEAVRTTLQERLASSEPSMEIGAGYDRVDQRTASFESARFVIAFDQESGCITQLLHKETNRDWASGGGYLGRIVYETYSSEDYDRFLRQYIVSNDESVLQWALCDFGKPGLEKTAARSARAQTRLAGIYRMEDENGLHFAVKMTVDDQLIRLSGCPASFLMRISLPNDESSVSLDLNWSHKRQFRLPESVWLSFRIPIRDGSTWTLDKLGQIISPFEVVSGGSKKLHGIHRYVTYADSEGSLQIETLDAPLVMPGRLSALDFDDVDPVMSQGVHVNLYNNLWGTNFPMWFGEDARFRFVVRIL